MCGGWVSEWEGWRELQPFPSIRQQCVFRGCLTFCGAGSHRGSSAHCLPVLPSALLPRDLTHWPSRRIYPVAIASKHFWPIVTPQPNMCPHRHIPAKCINTIQTNILWSSACSFYLWCTLFSMVFWYNWVYFIFFKCQQQPTKLISGPINGLQPVLWHIKGLHLNVDVTSIAPVSHYHPLTLCCASARYSRNKLFWAPAACRAFLWEPRKRHAKKYPALPLKAYHQGP